MQHDLQLLDDAKNFYFPFLEEAIEIYKLDSFAITPQLDHDGVFKLYTSYNFETTLAPAAHIELEFDYYLGIPQNYIGIISVHNQIDNLLFIYNKTWQPEERYHRFRLKVKNISQTSVQIESGSYVARLLVLSCYRTCTCIKEIKNSYQF